MNNIQQKLKIYDLADATVTFVSSNGGQFGIQVELWNGKCIKYSFNDWLHFTCNNSAFVQLSKLCILERSELVVQMVNEYCEGEQSIQLGLDEYIEVQFWDSDNLAHPALTIVASEVQISEEQTEMQSRD